MYILCRSECLMMKGICAYDPLLTENCMDLPERCKHKESFILFTSVYLFQLIQPILNIPN